MSAQLTTQPPSEHTLCGPYDRQFRRKFLGHRSTPLLTERNRLLRSPALLAVPTPDTLLPKIREIEKIAKSGGRRRRGKQEVISELELYLAKKMVTNQSTKDLITRIEASTLRQPDFTSTRKYSQTSSKFYTPEEDPASTLRPGKKWISDQQFREKFERFVLPPHEQEERVRLTDLFGASQQQLESPEQLLSRIESDKGTLKDIVRKMIDHHNEDSQVDEEVRAAVVREGGGSTGQEGPRGIRWVIQSCQDFQKANQHKHKQSRRLTKKQ